MSYRPADHSIELAQIAAGEEIGTAAQLSTADSRSLKKLITLLIVASSISACTGSAGVTMPIEPVDHGCHSGVGADLGGEGSGCS
jgi:hypothetical protein